MEQKNLIIRTKDATDARRIFVSLTGTGKQLMDKYLASIHSDI